MGVCVPATICQPGQYETAALTNTSDRTCGSELVAWQCSWQRLPGAFTENPSFMRLLTCSSTTVAGCSGTEDFSNRTGATACTLVSMCLSGTELVKEPTLSSDRICRACVAGETYSVATPMSNQACTATTICPAGTEEVLAPTVTTDRQCQPCPFGTFRSSAMLTNRSSRCEPHTTCGDPSDVVRSPSATQNRLCMPMKRCSDKLTDADGGQRGCTCPQEARCKTCLFRGMDETAAWLRRVDSVPLSRKTLDESNPCFPLNPDDGLPGSVCEAACRQAEGCTSFFVSPTQCCLHSGFSADRGFVDFTGGSFYSLPECFECRPGFHLQNGVCNPPQPPPLFVEGHGRLPDDKSFRLSNVTILVGLPLAPHAELFTFQAKSQRNASSGGDIVYRLESSGVPFHVNGTSGKLTATQPLSFIGSIPLRVTAREDILDCATFSDGRNSCEQTVDVEVVAVGFRQCLGHKSVYVQTNETVAVTWASPELAPGELNLGSNCSLQPGAFPVGSTAVRCASTELDVGQAECNFTVNVQVGTEVVISELGVMRSATQQRYFLVDSLGTSDARRDTPPLHIRPFQRSFAVGFAMNGNQPLTAEIPDGVDAKFHMELTWCTTAVESSRMHGDATGNGSATGQVITAVTMAETSLDDLKFVDLGSGFHQEGDCFTFRVESQHLVSRSPIRIDAVELTFQGPPEADSNATTKAYRLMPGSFAYLGVHTANPVAVASMTDFEPPFWIACQSDEPVRLNARAGGNSSAAFWSPPIARDVGGEVTVTSSHVPGDVFSVEGSPHRVVYTAVDRAGLTSECVLLVVINYETVANTFVGGIDPSFKKVVTPNHRLGLTSVSQSVATRENESENSFSQFVTDLNVDLVGLNSIAITLALAQGRAMLRPVRASMKTVLNVDLSWQVRGIHVGGASNGLSRVPLKASFAFDDFTPSSGNASHTARGGDSCCAAASNTFASVHGEIQGDGEWIHVDGVSFPIHDAFTFSSITITLDFAASALDHIPHGLRSFRLLDGSTVNFLSFLEADEAASEDFLLLVDHEPPTLTGCPSSVVVSAAPGQDFAVVTWEEPVATDNVGVASVTASRASGSHFKLRTPDDADLEVVLTARDRFGNIAECFFTVTVEDHEGPVVQCPDPIVTVLAQGASKETLPVATWASVTTADNSRWPVRMKSPQLEDIHLGPGNHSVEIVVLDLWEQESTCVLSVSVSDAEAPELTCPFVNRIGLLPGQAEVDVMWDEPKASDNDALRSIIASPPSGSLFAEGETVVAVVATDMSGNVASCNFTVVVTPSADPALGSEGATTTIIVASSISGVVFALVVAVVMILFILRRKQDRKPQNWAEIFALMDEFDSKSKAINKAGGLVTPREINRKSVRLLHELGRGEFGLVSQAILQETVSMPGYMVAVKSLLPNSHWSDRADLLGEAAVVAQFDNANVIKLIGVCSANRMSYVVLEYAELGSLKTYLGTAPTDEQTRLMLAHQVCLGLQHIHSKRFIHRDVAARYDFTARCCAWLFRQRLLPLLSSRATQ